MVLFFYPKANTPGCTKQACGFRDEFQKFSDAGYTILGERLQRRVAARSNQTTTNSTR